VADLTQTDNITDADLGKWYALQQQLNKLKVEEHFLRLQVFKHYFKAPNEGTNTHKLPDDYQVKGVYVINRKVLLEQMQAMCTRPEVGPGEFGPSVLEVAGVKVSELIKWTPELAIKSYRELTDEQRKLVDQMLEIKEGSPQLKVDPPAKPRGKKAAAPDEVAEDKGPEA
jgi:hypothetical protein